MIEQAKVPNWLMGDTLVKKDLTPASEHCKHPDRWSVYGPEGPEIEVLKLLRSLLRATKPENILVVGDNQGLITSFCAQAARENGNGRVIGIEAEQKNIPSATERVYGAGLGRFAAIVETAILETSLADEIDVLVSDGDGPHREDEVRRFLPNVKAGGLILVHDAHRSSVSKALAALKQEGIICGADLPTPRGFGIYQKNKI